jgi:hypothetical protein
MMPKNIGGAQKAGNITQWNTTVRPTYRTGSLACTAVLPPGKEGPTEEGRASTGDGSTTSVMLVECVGREPHITLNG